MALGVCLITTIFTLTLVSLTPFNTGFLEEEHHFKQWMLQHNRVYDDIDEFYHRLHIFAENKRTIDHHNAGNHSFTMGLNQFSDMTFEEFRRAFLLTEPQNCSATKGGHVVSWDGLYPKSVDWRTKGNFVTPVKDQGHCGSCWTFSTTGCLESVTAITTGRLISLSEQQLIDCAKNFNNHGCMGGLPSQAFEYIKYNKGLMTEEDYPYKGYDDYCQFDPKFAAAFVQDIVNITIYDEKAMVDAVARLNPVSFAFEVTHDFVHYKEGVYTRCVECSAVASLADPNCFHIDVGPQCTQCASTADRVNHAVLAVGYGADENDTLYWIVKNSWGTAWGIDGYFLIERGKNMCGLAACSSYPIPQV